MSDFPPTENVVEPTAIVQEALKRKLPFSAFRISTVCQKADCASDTPQNYYFGGFINIWAWPKSEPPLLEITP